MNADGVGEAVDKRKELKKKVAEDRDEVLIEVCMSVDKTCEDIMDMKDVIDKIQSDVTDIRKFTEGLSAKSDSIEEQVSGMTDLLTEHVEHHPKLRVKNKPPPTIKESIIEARAIIVASLITGIFTFLAAVIVIG
jgi:hypothetical protein